MNRPYLAALILGGLLLAVTVELLRRRHLREKYAALWIVVGAVMLVVAAVPGLLSGLARWFGFAVPANLLFLGGGVLLTTISMQLSAEIGRLEGESQRLAEEIALLRMQVERLADPAPEGMEDGGRSG